MSTQLTTHSLLTLLPYLGSFVTLRTFLLVSHRCLLAVKQLRRNPYYHKNPEELFQHTLSKQDKASAISRELRAFSATKHLTADIETLPLLSAGVLASIDTIDASSHFVSTFKPLEPFVSRLERLSVVLTENTPDIPFARMERLERLYIRSDTTLVLRSFTHVFGSTRNLPHLRYIQVILDASHVVQAYSAVMPYLGVIPTVFVLNWFIPQIIRVQPHPNVVFACYTNAITEPVLENAANRLCVLLPYNNNALSLPVWFVPTPSFATLMQLYLPYRLELFDKIEENTDRIDLRGYRLVELFLNDVQIPKSVAVLLPLSLIKLEVSDTSKLRVVNANLLTNLTTTERKKLLRR